MTTTTHGWARLWPARKQAAPAAKSAACQHGELAPMWESVADMGVVDKITRYKCVVCQRIMPAAEGDALRRRRQKASPDAA